jgi:hypothetical protein
MDSSGSMLKTVIERVRGFLDDPDLEAKYNDDYILRHIIRPAFASVMSRINNSSVSPVMHRLSFPLTKNVADYQLPASVGEVWRLCILDSQGNVTEEAMPRGVYNARGPNWKIEGNTISFLPYPQDNYSTLELWYVHSGDFSPVYYSVASPSVGFSINPDKKSGLATISTPATIGDWDKRINAYVGQMFRYLPASSNYPIEERVISSWTPHAAGSSQWNFTLRTALTYAPVGAIQAFEISPEGSEYMYEAVAAASALKLASYRKLSGEHFGMIQAAYRDAMKTTMDHYSNVQMRMPKSWEKDTVDNQLTQPWRI